MIKNYKLKLLNKNKNEVISILGDGLNFYHFDTWIYLLDRKWWIIKRKLYIHFDQTNLVYSVQIKFEYF